MVGSMKGVLCSKNFSLRFERMEYLQICAGDFAPHRLMVQESVDG